MATSPCELALSRIRPSAEAAKMGCSRLAALLGLPLLLLSPPPLAMLLLRLLLLLPRPSALPLHWLQPLAPSPWGGIGGREVGLQRQQRRGAGHSGRRPCGLSSVGGGRGTDAIWGDLDGIVGVLRTGT